MALGTRWLGVGLATALAVVTIGLWATGRIGLYINPDAAWWAVSMSIVCVVAAVWSCAVPISREHEHEHEHDVPAVPSASSGTEGARSGSEGARSGSEGARSGTEGARSGSEGAGARPVGLIATGVGAVLASGLVALAVVMPPASLSAELALARSSGAPPVLSTSATLALATSDDTSGFGIGEWASLLSTTTDPARFVGEKATLTGFVGPDGDSDGFALTRLVIVHCVIDAQAANVPVAELAGGENLSPGQWVEVEGEFVRDEWGALVLQPASVTAIDEPGDPYEY
ncbi:MAG: DUF1980 domain-containing protein [Microbacterium sp.]|uniref:TIGR03943 family putative permease subunit n=1 Tax=Microbacterium sp. TaxID=51671 RepID=UPI0027224526|nr:DUF1980 domain-containing protein [Microbacterium sp.]MDO8383094.1 DUF1980 domain-containing protein [Microbacterium sp.]